MRLSNPTIDKIAAMICGNDDNKHGKHFPYRSSSRLTSFFSDCGIDAVHDGSTRHYWVVDELKKLNLEIDSLPDLPSDQLVTVIESLMDPDYFEVEDLSPESALATLNMALKRESLEVFLESEYNYRLRCTGTGISSKCIPDRPRPLTKEELANRERLVEFLDQANEDEFTSTVLVPFFQRLSFHRVNALGHSEKILEFGQDLWMKYRLPTGHWLYFCAQIKKGKIDAKGSSSRNVAEILAQAKMAFEREIFDPDLNRKVLLDHLFIISADRITRQAKEWLGNRLDKDQRRHVIFMDRDELLDHAARIIADLPVPKQSNENDEFPF